MNLSWRFSTLLLICITTLSASAISAFALENVPAKLRFAANVASPSSISFCNGSLWAYSIRNRSLLRLNADNGATLAEAPASSIGVDGTVIAMGCTGDHLFLAAQKRHADSGNRTYGLYHWTAPKQGAKGARASAVSMPGNGPVRDIFCQPQTTLCYLIRDRVYKSSDFRTWKDAQIPLSKEIKSQIGVAENPFAHWQDNFIIADGQYFRGMALDSELALLDPLRAAVVFFNLKDPKKSEKWGNWGVWEGRFMSPKGLTQIGPNIFAVSDVGLKLVFFFTKDGQYIGSIGSDAKSARFGYPLELVAAGKTLFVSDLGLNKVYAFDVNPSAVAKPATPPSTKDFDKDLEQVLRGNLFRDPEVLKNRVKTRCLSCHDGLEVNSLDKFMEHGKHHPVNVELRATKIDLPLENGKLVTCSSCHDAHHGGITEGAGATKVQTFPYMLRKPVKSLCVTCHTTKDASAFSHVNPNPKQSCASCHGMHVSQDYLLKQTIPELCYGCHGTSQKPASHPFSPDMVTCVSCHSLHDSVPKLSLATHAKSEISGGNAAGPTVTCLGCHEDKKALIGKSFHLGTESQMPHPWPKNEAMCLDCHSPHGKPKPVKAICSQCHDMKGNHPVDVGDVADTNRVLGIRLEGGKVSCITCHDPHGATPPNEKGRSFFKDAGKITVFCSSCHGEDATQLYQGFHGRKK